MDKREFLSQLEESLLRLSKSDRDDILLDYEEHFRAGAEKGMEEAEVAASLGDPASIAAQYLENLPADAKGAPVALPEPEPEENNAFESNEQTQKTESGSAPADNDEPTTGQKVANVFFWIGMVMVIAWIIYILIGVVGTIIGCFAGAVVLLAIAAFFISGYISISIGFALIAVGLICLGVLLIIGFKYAVIGVKSLIGLCKKTSAKILGRE